MRVIEDITELKTSKKGHPEEDENDPNILKEEFKKHHYYKVCQPDKKSLNSVLHDK